MTGPEHNYHYRTIARAIEYIAATSNRQPGLAEIAEATGLSPTHFQKIFSRWAGVSPKRFQQFITLGRAQAMLANRHTLLETSMSTGLSGTSRLHDLFLTWEAMTPGEYKKKGAGVLIRHGWFDSPFGPMLLMGTTRGICGIGFAGSLGRDEVFRDFSARWPNAELRVDKGLLADPAMRILEASGELNLQLFGAPFHVKVWEALLTLPYGRTTTYSDIACSVGSPGASRAVGTAVGRNPISWLIPCHRVIRKSGHLGGYHWGIPVKKAMLAREAIRSEVGIADSPRAARDE